VALALGASLLACDFPVDDSKYEIVDEPAPPFDRLVGAFSNADPGCEECLTNSCRGAIEECAATEGCTEFAECVRKEANPAGPASCESKMVDVTLAANVAYAGVSYCWMGCKAHCAVGTNWDCLDGYSVTQPPSATVTVRQSFTHCDGDSVQNAEVAYCDYEEHCGATVRTDETGTYSKDIPINVNGPLAGWRGFRRVVGASSDDLGKTLLARHRLERNLPIWSDHVESTVLLSVGCAADAVEGLRVVNDSAKWLSGTIGVQTFDCQTSGAEGVTLEVETAPDAAILYAESDGNEVWYVEESSTATGEGLALVADLPEGEHRIVARETKSGKVVGRARVRVPTTDVILFSVLPTPVGE